MTDAAVSSAAGESTNGSAHPESASGSGSGSSSSRGPRFGGGRVRWVALGVGIVAAALFALLTLAPKQSSEIASSPLVGKQAPTTAGPVIGGPVGGGSVGGGSVGGGSAAGGSGQVSLAALRGKWVLVNFFASWCTPCQQETPQLKAFYAAQEQGGDATILGVEYDPTDTGNAAKYLATNGATWPVINDPSADVTWGVHGIPESYIVSPNGQVVGKYTGGVTAASVAKQISSFGGSAAP